MSDHQSGCVTIDGVIWGGLEDDRPTTHRLHLHDSNVRGCLKL
jgi:hypothetical protein